MKKSFWLYAALLLTVALAYCLLLIRQGWIPHDEGVMAQMAERVLHGEMPHRDFDELYSGALTGLNALSFQLWGARLLSMRLPLLGFYLPFLFSIYALASRWLTPFFAFLFGLVCLGWGLPVYFAALPSWYLTFFAGYGTLFLMKYLESFQRRWLWMAGLCGGLSICFKSLGIYFVWAGITVLFIPGNAKDSSERISQEAPRIQIFLYKTIQALGILGFLIFVLWRQLGLKEFVHFLLPPIVLLGVGIRGSAKSLRSLMIAQAYFLSGVAIPLIVFLLIYVKTHAVRALYEGLFVHALQHYKYASLPLPSWWTMFYVLPIGVILWASGRTSSPWRHTWLYIALGVIGLSAVGGMIPAFYHAVWFSLRPLVPLLVVFGIWHLAAKNGTLQCVSLEDQRLFLVLTVMAFTSVVQFPFSFGVYFCYVAPFVALAGLAVFKAGQRRESYIGKFVFLAYAVFGYLWLTRATPVTMGTTFVPRPREAQLLPSRAGLVMARDQCRLYEILVKEIQKHAQGSSMIYAGPDCPEVYFLSGKTNPTRVFFEFIAPQHATMEQVLNTIDQNHIKVVVLNADPEFSHPISKTFYIEIAKRFTHHEDINQFRLFW